MFLSKTINPAKNELNENTHNEEVAKRNDGRLGLGRPLKRCSRKLHFIYCHQFLSYENRVGPSVRPTVKTCIAPER